MDFASCCNDPVVVVVGKLAVGQRELQLGIQRSNGRGFAQGCFCGRKLVERQLCATEIQVGIGKVVVQCNGPSEFAECLLVLPQFEISRSKAVMRRDETGISGDSAGQVLYRALEVIAHQELVTLLVFVSCLPGRFEIQRGNRIIGALDFGCVGIPGTDQEQIEIEAPRLNRVHRRHGSAGRGKIDRLSSSYGAK